ncbi:17278_t:CDS:2, partial [Acaulospora morrowiae]
MIIPGGFSSFVNSTSEKQIDLKISSMTPGSRDDCQKILLGQGGQQPSQTVPQTGKSTKEVGQDLSGISRFGYAWPFYGSQPVVPMYHHEPEVSPAPSPSMNISRASRRVGYDLQELNDDQLARLETHDEKFKKLKKDRMLYLFWVPTFWVMIALAIVQYNPFSI